MRVTIPHPRQFISEELAAQLGGSALDAEHSRMLTKGQWSAILDQNWLNMYVPRRFGGLELSLPEIVRLEEGISWADGSSGWVVTLCSGAAWFVGFLDPGLATDIFKSDLVCFAGSGAISGTADKFAGRYEISGFWRYATGSLMATVFTVNCFVRENGDQVYDAAGNPVFKSFLLMRDEVAIHRTWNAMGMVATGSNSIEVKNISIPENRCFTIDPNYAVLAQAIFRYPFRQLAESTLTANLSGLACKFLDLAETKLSAKSDIPTDRVVAESRAQLENARYNFYRHTDMAWDSLAVSGSIPNHLLALVTEASRQLAGCCAEVVTELYPFCGLEAADPNKEINRVWRNFHTAVQHNLFREFRIQSRRED